MNDTSGINVSPWVAPSGLHSLSSARPRALPWAGMVGPVGALKVALPEQTAIASVLTEMDGELAMLEQRREKTRALKQAMMQELLTGKTRLV